MTLAFIDQPSLFFGRETEVRTLYSRIATGQSVAIVGEPNIGKTFLLQHVSHAETYHLWLPDPTRVAFVSFDGRVLPDHLTPRTFWEQIFESIADSHTLDKLLSETREFIKQNDFGSFALERFFLRLSRSNLRVVLCLDHFDDMLGLTTLATADLFGPFRSISSRLGSLVLLVTSRFRVAELNRYARRLQNHGSPYFNTLNELRLAPFTEYEAREALLTRFSQSDAVSLLEQVGRHPYLISLALQKGEVPSSEVINAHFDLAFKSLGSFQQALRIALGETSPELSTYSLTTGDVDELIWRGWLKRDESGSLHPDSILLARWLESTQTFKIH